VILFLFTQCAALIFPTELLVRSHEVKDEGYLVEHDGKCITVFSAPNYCDQMGNKGAFIRFEKDMKPRFTQFTAVVRTLRFFNWVCLMANV
jgi:hypothetical protein